MRCVATETVWGSDWRRLISCVGGQRHWPQTPGQTHYALNKLEHCSAETLCSWQILQNFVSLWACTVLRTAYPTKQNAISCVTGQWAGARSHTSIPKLMWSLTKSKMWTHFLSWLRCFLWICSVKWYRKDRLFLFAPGFVSQAAHRLCYVMGWDNNIKVPWEETGLLRLRWAPFSGFHRSGLWRESLANHRHLQKVHKWRGVSTPLFKAWCDVTYYKERTSALGGG